MDLSVLFTYRIVVNSDEIRLLSRALRGKLSTDEDKAAALALQEKMLASKAKQLAQAMEEANKHLANIEESRSSEARPE